MRTILLLPVLLLLVFTGVSFGESEHNIPLHFNVPSIVSLEAQNSDLSFHFSDFSSGSVSNSVSVAYQIKANNSRSSYMLQLKLNDDLPGTRIEVNFEGYHDKDGGASLSPSQSGFVALSTRETILAKKNESAGENILSGSLDMTYRAVIVVETARADQNYSRSLTVSLAEI